MKVFVAGATGALGRRLVPLLIAEGHTVVGMTRSPARAAELQAAGAEAVIADAFDRGAVLTAVARAQPEVVVHQLTALSNLGSNMRKFDREFARTNRLRTEGTDHLLAAARAAGARRFVAQSFAGWPFAREGGPVKHEDDALDPDPPAAMRASLQAIQHLETTVAQSDAVEGVVLRYGGFYGPGTSLADDGVHRELVRKRGFPIVGKGTGVWSFVHIDDAARGTVAALARGAPGIYHIVDDDPAPVSAWLPYLATAVGAKPPRRIPVWLARLLAGEVAVSMMTQVRGASNAKAKRELGWQPVYPSWRDGFRSGLAEAGRPRAGSSRAPSTAERPRG